MPYRRGYNVLPGLEKLKGPIFDITDRDRYLAEKQPTFLESDMDPKIYEPICEFMRSNYPLPLVGNFEQLGMQVAEDLAIHRLDADRDWLASAHISFPSGWLPEEKIGRSFQEIHQHIPGMRLSNSRKLVETMVFAKPFERYVWGVIFENRLNGHPSVPKKEFDPNNPQLFVKYERQCIVGFPELSAALFTIRQYLVPEHEIDKPALYKALAGMNAEQIAYKGILHSYENLLSYLCPVGVAEARLSTEQQATGSTPVPGTYGYRYIIDGTK